MAFNQQQLEKEGIYEAKAPLPSLLTDLDQIAKFLEGAAVRRKQQAKNGGYAMLGGLIVTIICAVVLPPLTLLGILAMIGGLIWLIYSLVSGGKLLKHRERLGVASQRLAMLQQDAGAKAPFSLRLALASKPTELSSDAWHGRKNGKQQFLEESWLTLEGPLLDGTVVVDEVKDLTRKRTFSNARGKRKTKTRLTHLVNVRFCYPKELYGDARPAGQALHGEMKVSHSAILRGVRVTEKAIVMKALVKAESEILPTAGMLSVGGYRILNLARKMAAGKQGKTK
jgi:hypothetical protein